MYVLVSNIGYVGTFINIEDVNKIKKHFNDTNIKFVSLYFEHAEIGTVWLVRYKCGMIYYASTDYDKALIKHKELESINQLYDDLFGVYSAKFGFTDEFVKLHNIDGLQLETCST